MPSSRWSVVASLAALLALCAAPLVSSVSVATYSDPSCTQALPYTFTNASLAANSTTGSCYPAPANDRGITAYYAYCATRAATASQVHLTVIAEGNGTDCLKADSVVFNVGTQNASSDSGESYVAEGACVPLWVQVGGTGYTYWSSNLTSQVYGVVSCAHVVTPVSGGSSSSSGGYNATNGTNAALPTTAVSGWSIPLAALAVSVLSYVL